LEKLGYSLGPSGADGVFGDQTVQAVRNFQQDKGVEPSGEVDEATWRHLVEGTYKPGERLLYLKTPFFRGDDVRVVQKWLDSLGFPVGNADGIFGPATEKAVRTFQANIGLTRDGIAGPETFRAFDSLKRILVTNQQAVYPYRERPSSISALKGKKVAIDFEPLGAGGRLDSGPRRLKVLLNDEVCRDLAMRLGNLLEILGGSPTYSFEASRGRKEDRARFANRAKADFFVSVGLASSTSPEDSGSQTFFFAGKRKRSEEGERLAGLIQKELVGLLGLPDLGTQGVSTPLVRKTKMPAVIVNPVFRTNSGERALLAQDKFRQKVAVAIFDGLKTYLDTQNK
ncbi:MAG: N-acetylmuramoyl-L-alanine amidase, partial [Terriglobia bacterium]